MRVVFGALGWGFVALAIAGAFLPIVPTTVFVLAASYCFSRSSPRFEAWLRGNRWLGPVLARFSRPDGIPASAKRAAIGALWIAVLVSAALLGAMHWAAAAATIGLGAIGTLSILFGIRTASE
jgi:uncharacterized membrane protein YbaN (DUF454 family)